MKKILVLLFLFTASISTAEERPECVLDKEQATPFIATSHEVQKALDLFCQSPTKIYTTAEIDKITQPVIQSLENESAGLLKEYSWYLTPWLGSVWAENKSGKLSYPVKAYERVGNSPLIVFKNGSITVRELTFDNLGKCDQEVEGCNKKFKAATYLLNKMVAPFQLEKLKIVRQHVIELDTSWDKFVKDARSQTLLDIFATTWFYDLTEDSDDTLSPPPSRQWFLLHPTIIIENVQAAIDGEQLQEGIAVEVLGINWWEDKSSPIRIPFGISGVVSYSDIPGVEDIGYGLMLYFDNKYSFGVTDHRGDIGVFVTADLLKFIGDQKGQLDSWKKFLP